MLLDGPTPNFRGILGFGYKSKAYFPVDFFRFLKKSKTK